MQRRVSVLPSRTESFMRAGNLSVKESACPLPTCESPRLRHDCRCEAPEQRGITSSLDAAIQSTFHSVLAHAIARRAAVLFIAGALTLSSRVMAKNVPQMQGLSRTHSNSFWPGVSAGGTISQFLRNFSTTWWTGQSFQGRSSCRCW